MNEKLKSKKSMAKIALLIAMAFILGGGTLVTLYATGEQAIETGENIAMISHTEYRYGEPGQIVVRLVNYIDQPIAVDNCTATILYPNKTFYAQDQLMSSTGNIAGDHYYQFTNPQGPEGTYEYQAACIYASGTKTKTATNSFHLSSAFSTVFQNLTDITSDIDGKVEAMNITITTQLTSFQQEVQANFSQVLSAINGINITMPKSVNYTSILNEINLTTHDTYTYMAGTLATNINSILTTVGVINATVTRIETNTQNINTTVNAIKQNQEDQVYISTYSG